MTKTEILFDYNKALEQATKLENIAANIKKIGNGKLNDSMKNVSKNWTGENSEAYVKKGEKLKGKIVKSADGIKSTSATIRAMAKNIRDAELANLRTIEERSNK